MTLGKVKWNRALCRSVNQTLPCIRRERLEAKPRNNAPRSDEQKIKYATTLAQKGNLTKANSVITKELIPAIDDTTEVKLADKHPARLLTFNDQYWPDDEDALEFWRSQEGATALEQKLQHVQHTKVVSVSTSVWRP